MEKLKLFMMVIGCRPKERFTEQHDVFFGIAESLKELIPHVNNYWPEAKGIFHIDSWREVTQVNGYHITIIPKKPNNENEQKLFFINLGGYKPGEMDEMHYKMLVVAQNSGDAISVAKKTPFYGIMGFKGATSHIDDKFLLDVDDIFYIKDILPEIFKKNGVYSLLKK